jgi:hypothetical protein
MRFFRRGFQTIAFPLGREIPLVGEEHVRESLSVQLRKVGIEGIERQILVLRLSLVQHVQVPHFSILSKPQNYKVKFLHISVINPIK